jgi:predicted outer membrane repeat protein
LDNSPLTATNCLFSGNEAGAIIITNCQGSLSSISNCRFENDEAFTLGWTDAKTSVNQCQFEGNGGSIYINANLPDTLSSVTNCSFTGNGSTSYGPGIAISYASPLISNCTFTSNVGSTTASGTGGAIYINSFGTQIAAPTITQCSFTGNSAYRGGAIYNTEYSAANISNCTFSNNSATNHGGAIWGPVAKIKNCNFSGNSSLRYGGALYNAAYPVENSIFISNSARTGGGNYSNSSLTSVVNCVFSRNEADSFGGGMYNSAPPAFVTNCTFFGNKANVLGGPIYNTNYGNYNDSTFTNCIIWGNGSGIYNQNTAATAFSYSLVQGLGTFAAKHIIGGTVNPQFIDTAASNFHLLPSSPCIDQGKNSYIPAGIITDLDNGPRIMNSIVDFGAFEFGNIPLGMDLLHFSGKMLHNSSVLLDWQMNNDKPIHTTLQRSRDGKNYTSIYSIRTNPGLNNQSYVDEQPLNENYYRLEITDEQGTLHYSNTIFARLNASLVSTVIYPNPAKESIHLVTKATELLNSTAIITDLTGKVMLRINIASTDQLISLADLPQGIYLLRLANGTIFKISKQ